MSHQPVLGIVGAGQLARMTHQAAISLAVELRFLADRAHDPAASVAPGTRLGSAMSADDLRSFAQECDVVSFDHEVVDLETLDQMEEMGLTLRPSARTLRMVADKLEMRHAMASAGLPVPPIEIVRTTDALRSAAERFGPMAVKRTRGGYDGRGVFLVQDHAQAETATAPYLEGGETLIAEPLLDLRRELAVLVARRPGGQAVVYDPVETLQVDGQCRQITMPAAVPGDLTRLARDLACAAAEAVGAVGILAVELFEVDSGLLVNELAARPHNSGHHTIEAAVTSQFENHVRAVLDLPLGSPDAACPAAVTVNVIGRDAETDPRQRLDRALEADPGAHIHLYGKAPRFNRKLGHVTVCHDLVAEAQARARAVAEALGSLEVTG
jgi:5-(carboxyamino)imidazole ribonucleotide synthase